MALSRRHWQAPWCRWYLRICNAMTYTVTDDERLGEADFNAVQYDSNRRQVSTLANAPVRIDVAVRELHVVVQQSSVVLGLARYTTGFGGIAYSGAILPVD
jgi:hypothetical protein